MKRNVALQQKLVYLQSQDLRELTRGPSLRSSLASPWLRNVALQEIVVNSLRIALLLTTYQKNPSDSQMVHTQLTAQKGLCHLLHGNFQQKSQFVTKQNGEFF